MVEIFFKHFNKALAKFVHEDNYKFNLTMLYMDEPGANLQGVWNVYVRVTFLWHKLCLVNGTLRNVHIGNCHKSV